MTGKLHSRKNAFSSSSAFPSETEREITHPTPIQLRPHPQARTYSYIYAHTHVRSCGSLVVRACIVSQHRLLRLTILPRRLLECDSLARLGLHAYTREHTHAYGGLRQCHGLRAHILTRPLFRHACTLNTTFNLQRTLSLNVCFIAALVISAHYHYHQHDTR